MKVLHLLKTSVGAAWAYRQIAVLKGLGVDVEVVLPEDAGWADRYRDLGVPVHILEIDVARLKNPLRLLGAARALRQLVRTRGFDIVHSHFVGTTLTSRLALAGSGVLRVFQVPGPLHLERPLTKWLEILSAGPADSWLASCRATGEIYAAAGIAPDRLGLAYYGIDVERLRAAATAPLDLRAELGLQPESRIVGMVAYFYAPKRWFGQKRGLKGHEDLIDAVALLRARGHDLDLILVGGPWAGAVDYEREVRAYARSRLRERAIFLGHRTDVDAIYRNFDVAVHPSHSENVGGAVESLMAGVPTVASNVGGLPDLIIDGETGWLAPPRNAPALAEAILAALDDPSEGRRRAEAGQRLAGTLLDVRRNGEDVHAFYQRMMSRRRTPARARISPAGR